MRKGRPPRGADMADDTKGSEHAKMRLKLILKTVSGEKTVAEAAGEIGMSESAFHGLRSKWLEDAATLLEPARRGRPVKVTDPRDEEISTLKRDIDELMLRYKAALVREEIALLFPKLVVSNDCNTDKKKSIRLKKKRRKK